MNSAQSERILMDAQEMSRALSRISHEIIERNKGSHDVALVGIRTGGVYLSQRLAARIQQIEQREIPLGELDITLYRDDLSIRKDQPEIRRTSIPFNISDLKKSSLQFWLIVGIGSFLFEPIMSGKVSPLLERKTFRYFLKS